MQKKLVFSILLFCSVSFVTFADAQFRNTILDFHNQVLDFSETGLMDNIRGGKIVSFSPLDLEVGSVFVDIDGVAKKVAAIQEIGDEIVIETVQPEIREIFEFYDIPKQTITVDNDNVILDLIEDYDSLNRANTGKTFSKSYGEDGKVEVNLNGSVNLNIGIDVAARLPYSYLDTKGTWKFWKWKWEYKKGYADGSFNYNLDISGYLNATAERSWESKAIALYTYGIPEGISAGCTFYTQSMIEGKVSVTDTLKFQLWGEIGARCDLDGMGIICWPINTSTTQKSHYLLRNELDIEASVKMKQKIYLSLYVKLLGFSILEADVGGGPSLRFDGYIKSWIQYTSNPNPKLTKGGVIEADGSLGIFLEANAGVFNNEWEANLLDTEFNIHTFWNKKLNQRDFKEVYPQELSNTENQLLLQNHYEY